MPLFKPDGKKLTKDLATATATRDTLAERLKAAEQMVPERRSAAQRLAQDGADDHALDNAEQEVRKAEDRVSTLTAALQETTSQIQNIEQQLAELADQKQRADGRGHRGASPGLGVNRPRARRRVLAVHGNSQTCRGGQHGRRGPEGVLCGP